MVAVGFFAFLYTEYYLMNYLCSAGIFIVAVIAGNMAYAEPVGGIMIEQIKPDSVMVRRDMNEAATSARPAQTTAIGDGLKDVLRDHKISQLGRANEVISSQYGAQPLVETPPLELEEKPTLLQANKKSKETKKNTAVAR